MPLYELQTIKAKLDSFVKVRQVRMHIEDGRRKVRTSLWRTDKATGGSWGPLRMHAHEREDVVLLFLCSLLAVRLSGTALIADRLSCLSRAMPARWLAALREHGIAGATAIAQFSIQFFGSSGGAQGTPGT